jgi:hypothetical protein
MYVIDAGGTLKRTRRRPENWERLQFQGYQFLPERRAWDVVEREAILNAIGLSPSDFETSLLQPELTRWVRRRAAEYCRTGRVSLTADPDPK